MSKKGMHNYGKVRINPGVTLSTLADNSALAAAATGTMTSEGRLTSIDATYSMRDNTAGEGPIMIGVAHPDYQDAEIAQAITVAVTGTHTQVEMEQANRKVRVIGTFPGVEAGEVLNDGRPIKTKLNWPFAEGQAALRVFGFNASGAALTTGTILKVLGHLNVFWN